MENDQIVRTRPGAAELHAAMSDPIDDRELEAPEGLQRDLRSLLGRRVAVPDSIGAVLRAEARRRPPILAWRPLLASAAAALLLSALVVFFTWRPAQTQPVAREDFDHNGHVDVLDAYRLALALEHHQPVDPTFDLDGNGVIDRGDVDRIAARAVSVKG
jgi:hypothetical protein